MLSFILEVDTHSICPNKVLAIGRCVAILRQEMVFLSPKSWRPLPYGYF
jgi:hypothetical protein